MAAPVDVLVLMGVSGSGKSTIAVALEDRTGWIFQEGDDLHPPANVEKMRAGHPLDDADRAPWLAAIAAWIGARLAAGEHGIITCSALKRSYREVIAAGRPGVCFVYLAVSREALSERLAGRHHEYMPASLLDSQLATLEPPAEDEPAVTVPEGATTSETVGRVLAALGLAPAA